MAYELNVKSQETRRIVIDLGTIFGRLEVIEDMGAGAYGCAMYKVRCTCGTEKIVRGTDLRAGKSTSCGCYRRETTANLAKIRRPRKRSGGAKHA